MSTDQHNPSKVPALSDELPLKHQSDSILARVREGYSAIAHDGWWSQPVSQPGMGERCCSAAGGCCGPTTFTPAQLAAVIGYSMGELQSLPDGANMGLSCGNPTLSLGEGDTVLDLGSGGGFDCFIAGPKVGPRGRVIGVDMTAAMLAKARRNIASYSQQTGLDNVEFRLGEIENLPAADASIDVVISNCVLNLSPDKPRVWREIARVLRPGGRAVISDLALLRPLPVSIMADLEALIGCISGVVHVDEVRSMIDAAGFVDVTMTASSAYIDAMTHWDDPLYLKIIAALTAGSTPAQYITSLEITAIKP